MTAFIDPDRDIFAAYAKSSIQGPVQMLNLLKFQEKATYEDGTAATGPEAYKTYGKLSQPFFEKNDGKIIWSGEPQAMVIGPVDEWDAAFIAEYPSKDHFLSMVLDPDYQAITFHRKAALANSRLLCLTPLGNTKTFAG